MPELRQKEKIQIYKAKGINIYTTSDKNIIMEGKSVIGIALVIIMGVVIFGIVSLINATLDNLDDQCKKCTDNCKNKSCTDGSSSTGRMFSYVLIGIYLISAVGILYFSFKKEEEEPKITADPGALSETDEYAYG